MRFDGQWITAVVRGTRDLTPGIREFTLVPEGGATPYATGSHLCLRVMVDGRTDLRRYSLVGDQPRDGCWRIAVKREEPGRGGSRYMWSLPVGARLEVTAPDSFFQLSGDAPEYLLVAGGIGITPIRGMASALRRRGARFRMLYAGRSRAEMAYLGELEAELGAQLDVFSEAEGRRIDLKQAFSSLEPEAETYICGPIGLLEVAKREWAAAGRPRARLVFETFGSSGRHPTEAFTVRLPRLGLEVQVPANSSMLEALEASGVGVLSDCRRGECGLCAMDVLDADGIVDHRDVFFSDHQHEEGRRICACVSRVVGGAITVDTAFRGDERLRSGPELQMLRP